MRTPSWIENDDSSLGLIKQLLNEVHVAFLAKVTKIDYEHQSVDVTPLVTEPNYLPSGDVINVLWPPLQNVPLCTIGFGSWYLTMPIDIGTTVLVICNDLSIKEWYKRGQEINVGTAEYHTLNNAIAIAGLNPSTHSIKDYYQDGPEIRNVNGNFSAKISEAGINLSIGSSLVLSITGDSINIVIGGNQIAQFNSSGLEIKSLDVTVQGVKLYDWLINHIHAIVQAGQTEPAGRPPEEG